MSDSSYYRFNYQYYPLYAQGPGPLPGQTSSNQQQPCLAGGVNSSGAEVSIAVRVVNPEKKKESKVFKLRSICTKDITTPQQLRDELFTQFGDEIVSDSCDFAVGYFRGQQKLWIRTAEDLEEAWSLVSTGRGTLWCDGVNFAKKKLSSDEEDSGQNARKKPRTSSANESKQQRVEDIKEQLQAKHGSEYSPMQYRLWAEMVAVGTHTSCDLPPQVPMFTGGRAKNKSPTSDLTTAFTSMAEAVAGALKPKESLSTSTASTIQVPASGTYSSPGRVADIRSKYIQQLRELHSLLEVGVLTETEFVEQKQPILDQLRKFKP